MSLNLVTDTASRPIDWRLFVPEPWDTATPETVERRRRAAMPADVRHQET
ncbi:transposase [Asanoa siamensis]|uniref:Transposase IS701-like DDE domain-containing protein n=1 Tax=Asanoa siamensis TaxID=926357 RepID=A0ABQ4D0B2_9ACTN|nr:hypothetical protein Asi02nite_65070 [Asanoa siamensis]